jgi:hypothetical protein
MPNLSIVNVTNKSTIIFGGQGSQSSPIQLINQDTINTVYVAYASNLSIGQPGVYPIGPLASMAFDGTVSVWGITAGPTVAVGVIPGGSNYSPGSLAITGPVTAAISGPVTVSSITAPVAVSAITAPITVASVTAPVDIGTVSGSVDINTVAGSVNVNGAVNATGVGGFINPGQSGSLFVSGGPLSIPPNSANGVASNVSVQNYSSIVLTINNITNSSVAATAAICVYALVVWQDSNGINIGEDDVSLIMPNGGVGTSTSASWEIPCKGSAFSIQVLNLGAVGNILMPVGSLRVDGSYRVVPDIRVQTSALTGLPPAITGASVGAQGTPVYEINSWVSSLAFTWAGAVANQVFLLAPWRGQISGYYQVTSTALVKNVTIVDLTFALQNQVVSGAAYPFGIIQNLPGSILANPVALNFNLPPTQCAIIIDTPATAGSFTMSLIGNGN